MKKMLSFLSALSLTIPTATIACSYTENVDQPRASYQIDTKLAENTRHLEASSDFEDDSQDLIITYDNDLSDYPRIDAINNIVLDFSDSWVNSDSSNASISYLTMSQSTFSMSEFTVSNGVIAFNGFANSQYEGDGIRMDVHGEIALTYNGGVHVYIESQVTAYNTNHSKNTAGKGYGRLSLTKMILNYN